MPPHRHSRIVDQNVQSAEFGYNPFDCFMNRCRTSLVDLDGNGLPAQFLNFPFCSSCPVLSFVVADGNIHTLFRQTGANLRPQATAASGN